MHRPELFQTNQTNLALTRKTIKFIDKYRGEFNKWNQNGIRILYGLDMKYLVVLV